MEKEKKLVLLALITQHQTFIEEQQRMRRLRALMLLNCVNLLKFKSWNKIKKYNRKLGIQKQRWVRKAHTRFQPKRLRGEQIFLLHCFTTKVISPTMMCGRSVEFLKMFLKTYFQRYATLLDFLVLERVFALRQVWTLEFDCF